MARRMTGRAGAALVGLTALVAATAPASAFTCTVEQTVRCADGACEGPTLVPIRIVIDTATTTYRRCTDRGCESYTYEAARSGSFVTYTLPGRGAFLRVDLSRPDRAPFVEVLAPGAAVIANAGLCGPDS